MLLVVVFSFFTLATSFPIEDPFSPIGPWFRQKPPCGLPSFIDKLPAEAEQKVREIWANYKEGEECDKEHQETREVIHALPEEIRHQVFVGRCGPSFLRNVSKTVRHEFRSVWFNHRLSTEQKELQLKKLAYSLLSGESLALFNKWDEELQIRKTEFAEKIEGLSVEAREAIEQWKALRFKEREFLANLPKHIRAELKTLCKHYRWNTKTTDKPSEVTTEEGTTMESVSENTTGTEETVVTETTEVVPTVTSEAEEKAEKEFAIFLDVNVPDIFTEEAECEAFY